MSIQIQTISLGMVNCYLLKGDGCVLIDAGVSGQISPFLKAMEKNGTKPEEIEIVILTHGHVDHIGLARKIKELSGAKLMIHQREADWLANGESPIPPGVTTWGKILSGLGKHMPTTSTSAVEADILIGDEGISLHPYGIPGEVIYTPGHTMGSISVLLESGEAFVGDLAMSARFMRRTPGIPIFAEDIDLIPQSWKKLLGSGAKRIYPAHGKPFGAEVFRNLEL